MFQRLPSYPDLSPNPFWDAQVPSHWSVVPGLAVIEENKRKNNQLAEDRVLSLSYGRVIVKPVEKQRGLVPESYEGYQVLDPGDIVIRPTDLQNDQTSIRVGMVRDRGIITSAYIGLRPKGSWSADYAYAYLVTVDSTKRIYGMGSGLRQQLGWDDLKRMHCLVPPPEEQAAIVKYLAHANARIDKAIAAKRRLIALLEEQVLVEMMDAFAYLQHRDVPTVPLKHLVRVKGGTTPSKENRGFWDGGTVPWVSPKDMKSESISGSIDRVTDLALSDTTIALIPRGAVLVVVRGMILARRVPVALTSVEVTLNQDMKALIARQSILEPEFLRQLLKIREAEILRLVEVAGHGTRKLETADLLSLRIPVPSLTRQRELCAVAHSKSIAARETIRRIERESDLLREFRARLVADVVTGQFDVREIASSLPQIDLDAARSAPGAIEDPDSAGVEEMLETSEV